MNTNKSMLVNLDNPNYCKKIIDSYEELNTSIKHNLSYFDELIKTNKKKYSNYQILRKAQQYFPVVDKSYNKILATFRKFFQDDNLEFNEIKEKLSDLITEEYDKKETGVNKENNNFLESIGIQPELGGEYTVSELKVFSSAFLLLNSLRNMLAKLSTIYALYDNEYHIEGETDEGFQY